MPSGKSILIVDDDPATHTLLDAMLQSEDLELESAYDGYQALARLDTRHFDLVLTDIHMPGMDGLTLLKQIRERHPDTKVVVMTAETTAQTVVLAIRDQAFSYLSKPLSRAGLIDTIQGAFTGQVDPDDIEVLSARPGWISIRLRCKMVIADRLAQFFREISTELSPEERESISTAFRELLMNAIEHGGKSNPDERVNMTYVRTGRAIIYYIKDPGEGFSFRDLKHAAVSNTAGDPFEHAEVRDRLGIRPGGFGILLTKNFADELIYSEKGNEVMLVKYLPQDRAAGSDINPVDIPG